MGKLLGVTRWTAIIIFVVAGLALLAFSLPHTGWRALSVQTGSMKPAIPPGSLVLVHSVPQNTIKKGDVITYKGKTASEMTITHRVQERKKQHNGLYRTIVKGDANRSADAPIYDSQIIGRVETSVPYLGKALGFVKTPLGLALLVYLPALIICIAEIRLLVRRLTKLEIEKQKPKAAQQQLAAAAADTGTAPIAEETPVKNTSHTAGKKRLIGRMGMILVPLVLGATLTMPTLSELTTDADLAGNTISTLPIAPPSPPPNTEPHVIFQQIDFPRNKTKHKHWWKHGNHTNPVSLSLYSPKRWKRVDVSGWTISSSSGQLYRFKGNKITRHQHGRELDIELKKYPKLNLAGDFLVLKNATGTIIDAISWGTDTTYLNPSIQNIRPGDDIRRKRHKDTDRASDWRILD